MATPQLKQEQCDACADPDERTNRAVGRLVVADLAGTVIESIPMCRDCLDYLASEGTISRSTYHVLCGEDTD